MSICATGREWNWKEQIKFHSAGIEVMINSSGFRHLSFRFPRVSLRAIRARVEPSLARWHLLVSANVRIDFVSFKHATQEFQTGAFPLDVRSQMNLQINDQPCWILTCEIKSYSSTSLSSHFERRSGMEKVFRKHWSSHKCCLRCSSVGGILRSYSRDRRRQQ